MVIILHGPDSFRSREKVNEIISAYRAKYGTRMFEARIDGGIHAWDDLRNILYGGSLFAEKRLVVVRNIHTNKDLLGHVVARGKDLGRSDFVLVFWEDSPLRKTKDQKALLAYADQQQEFLFLAPARLRSWAQAFAKQHHINADPRALTLLVEWSGGNTWYLANEIRKLGAYARGRTVEEGDVRALSRDILDSHIFKTIDALFAGDRSRGLALLADHLARGEEPARLLAMLAREVHVLATLKGGSRAGLNPYVAQKSAPRAKAISWEKLHRLAYLVHEADLTIKKGARDPSVGLELLGAEISSVMASSVID